VHPLVGNRQHTRSVLAVVGLCASSRVIPLRCGQFRMINRSVMAEELRAVGTTSIQEVEYMSDWITDAG